MYRHVPSHVCQGLEVTCKLLLRCAWYNSSARQSRCSSSGSCLYSRPTEELTSQQSLSSWKSSLCCSKAKQTAQTVVSSNTKMQRHVLLFVLNATAVITVWVDIEYTEWRRTIIGAGKIPSHVCVEKVYKGWMVQRHCILSSRAPRFPPRPLSFLNETETSDSLVALVALDCQQMHI